MAMRPGRKFRIVVLVVVAVWAVIALGRCVLDVAEAHVTSGYVTVGSISQTTAQVTLTSESDGVAYGPSRLGRPGRSSSGARVLGVTWQSVTTAGGRGG